MTISSEVKKILIVLIGPTGVGKTDLSLSLSQQFDTPILSADSRQFYKELKIGTAAPTEKQLKTTKHYFVGMLDLASYYNAWEYEKSVISLLEELYKEKSVALLTGGSMMYVDSVCKGIDYMPSADPDIRNQLQALFEAEGLDSIRLQLKQLDPIYYDQVDLKNHKRVLHALEICLASGKPYSSFRTNKVKERPFEIVKIGLRREREELYERINLRVDQMIEDGLLDEVKQVLPYRNYNSLNTVGYKELFPYFDGECTLDAAIEKIKQHSRIYSRKQMSWFKRDKDIMWFHPDEKEAIIQTIKDRENS